MAVFVGPKSKGGRGQVLRTCRLSLDREQSRRRLDRRRRRRTGWRCNRGREHELNDPAPMDSDPAPTDSDQTLMD